MASILKVDDLRGNTAAGNITITSEGGSATMQLQQGVAKAWATVNGSSGTPSLTFSLNCSSNVDNGVGNYHTNLTNAMSSTQYPVTTNDNERGCGESVQNAASTVVTVIRNPTNLATVDASSFFTLFGDLA